MSLWKSATLFLITSISFRREALIKSASVFFPSAGTLVAVTACDIRLAASNTGGSITTSSITSSTIASTGTIGVSTIICGAFLINSSASLTCLGGEISSSIFISKSADLDNAAPKLLRRRSSFSFFSSIFFNSSCAEEPRILAKFSRNFFSSILLL